MLLLLPFIGYLQIFLFFFYFQWNIFNSYNKFEYTFLLSLFYSPALVTALLRQRPRIHHVRVVTAAFNMTSPHRLIHYNGSHDVVSIFVFRHFFRYVCLLWLSLFFIVVCLGHLPVVNPCLKEPRLFIGKGNSITPHYTSLDWFTRTFWQ